MTNGRSAGGFVTCGARVGTEGPCLQTVKDFEHHPKNLGCQIHVNKGLAMIFLQKMSAKDWPQSVVVACVVLSAQGPVMAQTPSQTRSGIWQLALGWQHYSESQMQLSGPELGLHWQSRNKGAHRLEVDAALALQSYSSTQTGTLDAVPNIDTRWRVLTSSQAWSQWHYGLALHTHFNFLRGTTSLGFGGYDRLSTQIWLPVRWQSLGEQPWAVDAGWLLWGEHVSKLSQVNTSLQDVRNTQRKGAYVQASTHLKTTMGELQPYARLAWLDDSDVRLVIAGGEVQGAFEPRSKRLQVGVKWRFR